MTVGRIGTLNIKASGAYWGSGTPSEFVLDNDGQVILDAGGTNEIRGDYLNAGTTTLKQGTLAIKGKAEQSDGLFRLKDRTTVDVSTAVDSTLYILRGTLDGDGTVAGTLSLSKQGSTDFAGGGVSPGWADQDTDAAYVPGTLNVTGDFRMWTPGCAVYLKIKANGASSRLVVAGQATLTGKVTVNWHPDYKPPAGTSVTLFSYGGQRTGTFQDVREYTPGGYWNGGVWVEVYVSVPTTNVTEGVIAAAIGMPGGPVPVD